MAENEGQTETEAHKPNIILAGQHKPVTVPIEDVHNGEVNIGMHTIELPDEATQRAGWYEKDAWMLIQQYPGVYKEPKPLGRQELLNDIEDEDKDAGGETKSEGSA